MEPEERAAAGVFLAMQYPVEIPGVANMYFLRQAMNAHAPRARRGRDRRRRVHEAAARQGQGGRRRPRSCSSATSTSASPAARRSATRSCRWRCSSRACASWTRPTSGLDIDALRTVADGVNALRDPSARHHRDHPLPAPARLHRARPGPRAGLWPDPALRRQGAGAGARGRPAMPACSAPSSPTSAAAAVAAA